MAREREPRSEGRHLTGIYPPSNDQAAELVLGGLRLESCGEEWRAGIAVLSGSLRAELGLQHLRPDPGQVAPEEHRSRLRSNHDRLAREHDLAQSLTLIIV